MYAAGKQLVTLNVIPESSRVEVRGLATEALEYLDRKSVDLQEVFGVYAIPDGKEWDESTMPVDGAWNITSREIIFSARHPWLPEVNYYARLDLEKLNALVGQNNKQGTVDTSFTIQRSRDLDPEKVTGIYPSADTLPQNLLKFYIHFSGPMSRGDIYKHIHILNEQGDVIPDAFLELSQELWDPRQTRLTILFDPGRIKRGLERHNLVGTVFEAGKKYTLVVDGNLVDGNGLPIGQQFQKSFNITGPDRDMPDHDKWSIKAPAAQTREPLHLQLDEPLDHALLQRLITVTREGQQIAGKVTTSGAETEWHFTPERPWKGGNYELDIKLILEDLAGNNLISVFDLNLSDSSEPIQPASIQSRNKKTIKKEFTIRVPG